MPQTYTVKQVADLLGYSTNSIYTFLKEKRIKGVRIGKGRFRIPQQEVNRLLHLSKQSVQPMLAVQTTQLAPAKETVVIEPVSPVLHQPRINMPSLFEWFIGTASILVGLSLFLYNRHLEEYTFLTFLFWLTPIRVAFLAGGIGLLLTDLMGLKRTGWHITFAALVTGSFLTLALLFAQQQSWDAVIIYGLTALMIGIRMMIHLRSNTAFLLYVIAFFLFFPLGFLQRLMADEVLPPSLLTTTSPLLLMLIWFAIVILGLGILRAVFRRFPLFFGVLIIALATVLLSLVAWYAQELYWGRAVMILVLGLCTIFAPFWHSFHFYHARDRTLVTTAYISIIGILAFALSVIFLIQRNQTTMAQAHLEHTAEYGSFMVESTVSEIAKTLTSAAEATAMQEAIRSNDQAALRLVAHTMIDSNPLLETVSIASASHTLVMSYPWQEPATQTPLSPFLTAQLLQRTTPLITTDDSSPRQRARASMPTLTIAVPMWTTQQAYVGALIATVDLDLVSIRMQQLSPTGKDEAVFVTDSNNMILLHPQRARRGMFLTDTPSSDMDSSAIGEKRSLLATTPVETLQWNVISFQPVTEALKIADTVTFITFFACVSLLVGGLLLSLAYFGKKLHIKL